MRGGFHDDESMEKGEKNKGDMQLSLSPALASSQSRAEQRR